MMIEMPLPIPCSEINSPIHTRNIVPATSEKSVAIVGRALPPVKPRSEEHTSELQSLMRISYAVFCLKKKRPLILNTAYTYKINYQRMNKPTNANDITEL